MPLDPELIGRARELEGLKAALSKPSVAVVTGMAGIGKSSLAAAVAARWEQALVCDMKSVRRDGTGDAARLVHAPTNELLTQYIARNVGAFTKPLVVLDGADTDGPLVAELGAWLLANVSEARVVVTARQPIAASDDAPVYVLDGILEEDAHALFVRFASELEPGFNPDRIGIRANDFYHRYDGHPAAIKIAVAWWLHDGGRTNPPFESFQPIAAETWRGLSENDTIALAALLRSSGHFGLDAARVLLDAPDKAATCAKLLRLRKRGLVESRSPPSGERFRLPAILREWAPLAVRAIVPEERGAAITRFYAEKAHEAGAASRGVADPELRRWADREFWNLSAVAATHVGLRRAAFVAIRVALQAAAIPNGQLSFLNMHFPPRDAWVDMVADDEIASAELLLADGHVDQAATAAANVLELREVTTKQRLAAQWVCVAALLAAGRLDRARDFAASALIEAHAAKDTWMEAAFQAQRCAAALEGESASDDIFTSALDVARRAGNLPAEAAIEKSRAELLSRRGFHDEAVQTFDRAGGIYRELADRYGFASAERGAAIALERAGKPGEAISRLKSSMGALAMGLVPPERWKTCLGRGHVEAEWDALCLGDLAACYRALGAEDAAKRYEAAAEEYARAARATKPRPPSPRRMPDPDRVIIVPPPLRPVAVEVAEREPPPPSPRPAALDTPSARFKETWRRAFPTTPGRPPTFDDDALEVIDATAKKWADASCSTEPVDRVLVEKLARAAYEVAELRRQRLEGAYPNGDPAEWAPIQWPEKVVWCGSPASLTTIDIALGARDDRSVAALHLMDQVGGNRFFNEWDDIRAWRRGERKVPEYNEADRRMGVASAWALMEHARFGTDALLWGLSAALREADPADLFSLAERDLREHGLDDRIATASIEALLARVRLPLPQCYRTWQSDRHWAEVEARDRLGLRPPDEPIRVLMRLNLACPFWLPRRDVFLACERPALFQVEEPEGRPGTRKATVRFVDGFELRAEEAVDRR